MTRYPRPASPDDEWRRQAACRDTPTSHFFTDDSDWRLNAAAKVICRQCPVIESCREAHLGEHYGVFGGLTPLERQILRRRRRRVGRDGEWTSSDLAAALEGMVRSV